jgi:hypothetical protein
MNPAASARRNKEAHPERYCASPRCLWRTVNGRTGEQTPCRNHPGLGSGKARS